jgi:hypothetical protein
MLADKKATLDVNHNVLAGKKATFNFKFPLGLTQNRFCFDFFAVIPSFQVSKISPATPEIVSQRINWARGKFRSNFGKRISKPEGHNWLRKKSHCHCQSHQLAEKGKN